MDLGSISVVFIIVGTNRQSLGEHMGPFSLIHIQQSKLAWQKWTDSSDSLGLHDLENDL